MSVARARTAKPASAAVQIHSIKTIGSAAARKGRARCEWKEALIEPVAPQRFLVQLFRRRTIRALLVHKAFAVGPEAKIDNVIFWCCDGATMAPHIPTPQLQPIIDELQESQIVSV